MSTAIEIQFRDNQLCLPADLPDDWEVTISENLIVLNPDYDRPISYGAFINLLNSFIQLAVSKGYKVLSRHDASNRQFIITGTKCKTTPLPSRVQGMNPTLPESLPLLVNSLPKTLKDVSPDSMTEKQMRYLSS